MNSKELRPGDEVYVNVIFDEKMQHDGRGKRIKAFRDGTLFPTKVLTKPRTQGKEQTVLLGGIGDPVNVKFIKLKEQTL